MEQKKLNEFEKLLDQYRYCKGKSHIDAFGDFLEVLICFFSPTIRTEQGRFNTKELQILNQMINHLILTQNYMLQHGGKNWYDFFGSFYEKYAAKWSIKNRGQFFTPPEIVDFMTFTNIDIDSQDKYINDPACGSGRLLLASHAYNPKNFHFGQDIDRTCCMMTAINMAMHGCVGEVVWGDSLNYTSYIKGWKINSPYARDSNNEPIPTIIEMEKEESYINKCYEVQFLKNQKKKSQKLEEERLQTMPFNLFNDDDF